MYCQAFIKLSLLLIPSLSYSQIPLKKFSFSGFAQGTTYKFTYYDSTDVSISKYSIDSIFAVLNESLSSYNPNSVISRFNSNKLSVVCDSHFNKVITASKEIFTLSHGVFDVTIGAITLEKRFGDSLGNLRQGKLDSACINSNLLVAKDSCVSKLVNCIKVDLDGIAQGYSVDVFANFFEKHRIHNYILDIGGELRWSGLNLEKNDFWKVGIEAPRSKSWESAQHQVYIKTPKGSLTTSGQYRKMLLSGENYSGLFNARKQKLADEKVLAVSVFSQSAMLADGYDNVFIALGLRKSKKLVKKNPAISFSMTYIKRRQIKSFTSPKFPIVKSF